MGGVKLMEKEKEYKELEKFLCLIPLFNTLDDKSIEYICLNSYEKTYVKGEVICEKGKQAFYIYVLKEGEATEFALDFHEFSMQIKKRKSLDYFGEMGVLLEEVYATTVIATANSKVITIPGHIFSTAVFSNPDAMKAIIRLFRIALQNSFHNLVSHTMFDAEGRIAYKLIMYLNENNNKKLLLSQEDIGIQCGVSRQTVSRILNEWRRCGYVSLERCSIEITNLEALTDILISNFKY